MLDHEADRPLYRQVADQLEERIASGTLRPGFPLPAEKAIQSEFGVSRTTVRQAMAVLRDAGLVITRRAFGTYVRELRSVHVVRLAAGTVTARAASRREAHRFGLAVGAPVLVLVRGEVRVVVPADRVTVEIIDGSDSA